MKSNKELAEMEQDAIRVAFHNSITNKQLWLSGHCERDGVKCTVSNVQQSGTLRPRLRTTWLKNGKRISRKALLK